MDPPPQPSDQQTLSTSAAQDTNGEASIQPTDSTSTDPNLLNPLTTAQTSMPTNGTRDTNGESVVPSIIPLPADPIPSDTGSLPAAFVPLTDQSISADEIALYDRQIRLWGVAAQEKIRTANVLLITVKGLANEIAKNLVLAGVGALTIQDNAVVTEDDLGAQFFVSEVDIGKNRAEAALPQIQKLNPRVLLNAEIEDIRIKDQNYFAPYTIVIATDLDLPTFCMINAACRLTYKPFYAAGTHGMYGFIFSDLIDHAFMVEREKSNRPTAIGPETTTRSVIGTSTRKQDSKVVEIVTKREIYSPIILANSSPLPADQLSSRRRKLQVPPLISCLRALWEFQKLSGAAPGPSRADLELYTSLATQAHRELQLPPETLRAEFLRSFLQNVGSEIAPVTAFLGGQLAQDVINVIGQREQPIQNFLLFDGEESKGPVYALHPIFDAEAALDPNMAAPLAMPAMPDMGASTNGTVLV